MATAIAGSGANGVTIRNVRIQTTTTAISHGGDGWIVDDVVASVVTNFLVSTAGHSDLRISNSLCAGLIDISDVDHASIVGNRLDSIIDLGAATNTVIANNYNLTPGGSLDALLNGNGGQGLVYVGNDASDGGGYDAVALLNYTDFLIADNLFGSITGGISIDTCSRGAIQGNVIGADESGGTQYLGEHGILVDDSSQVTIQNNLILHPGSDTTNTFDGIQLLGNSDDNTITGNQIVPRPTGNTTRYGINIAASTCDNNVVFANFLGDSSDYGTADSVDSGTGTITSAAGGVIGGQFAY